MPEKLIIFDCDGVLVDSELLAARAYQRVYANHGMSLKGEILAQCIGMKQADIIARIQSLTGFELPPASADELWAETKSIFTRELQPTEGIIDLLRRHSGARCIASSSSIERIRHSLSVTGLWSHFGGSIFSSSMVARGKPAPDLFLHAARSMGYPPDLCIVVEDSPFGIEGAIAAVMTALGYTGGSHTYPGHAERLLRSGARHTYPNWEEAGRALFHDMTVMAS